MIPAIGKRVLTFDCYGTLIDWETGMLNRVRLWFQDAGRADVPDDLVLTAFALHQARHQQPRPAALYPDVLRLTWRDMAATFGLPIDEDHERLFAESCGDWPPFPDTIAALEQLSSRFALVTLSNVDNASLARSLRRLLAPFLLTVTAEDVGSYKPGLAHFETALKRLSEEGYSPESILHVAKAATMTWTRLGGWASRPFGSTATMASVGQGQPSPMQPNPMPPR